MHGRIAHDAFGADGRAPGFELRFDQDHRPGVGGAQSQRRRQQCRETDKAGIADQGIDGVRYLIDRQMSGIGLFMHHDASIATEFPCQLTVSYINRMNLCRAMRQQNVSEAASGGADIQANSVTRRQTKMRQRMIQLEAATRHPRVILTPHVERNIIGQLVPGLGNAAIAGKNFTRKNKCLRAGAAFH